MVTGVQTCALPISGINYPISKVQEAYNNKKATVSFKSLSKYFADQTLQNIGFPVVNDYLEKKIPIPKDSLSRYLRSSSIASLASLSGSLASLPLYIKDNETFGKTISSWIKSIPGIMCTNDSFAHFSNVIKKVGI